MGAHETKDARQGRQQARPSMEEISFFSALIGLVTGIGSILVIAVQIYRSPPSQADVSDILWYVLGVNFLFIVGTACLAVSYHRQSKRLSNLRLRAERLDEKLARNTESYEAQLGQIAVNLETISSYRAELVRYLFDALNRREYAVEDLRQHYDGYLDVVLMKLSMIFEKYTGCECSVCIKLFVSYVPFDPESEKNSSAKEQRLVTLRRDANSRDERRATDKQLTSYLYDKNTAFHHILHDLQRRDYFYCNNLQALDADGGYYNANPDWRKHYNATAVTPIKNPKTSAKDDCLGFLCIDNKGGRFDETFCRSILANTSNSLYYVFGSLVVIRQASRKPGGQHG